MRASLVSAMDSTTMPMSAALPLRVRFPRFSFEDWSSYPSGGKAAHRRTTKHEMVWSDEKQIKEKSPSFLMDCFKKIGDFLRYLVNLRGPRASAPESNCC